MKIHVVLSFLFFLFFFFSFFLLHVSKKFVSDQKFSSQRRNFIFKISWEKILFVEQTFQSFGVAQNFYTFKCLPLSYSTKFQNWSVGKLFHDIKYEL